MNDDEFRVYLFMIFCRGTALQNLYYSYNMINEGQKWRVTKQALQFKRENYEILKHSRLIGGDPTQAQVYGYSCWDGSEGIVAIRNPSPDAQTFTLTLNSQIGVPKDLSGARRRTILNFRNTLEDDNTMEVSYGDSFEKDFQPGEVAIWRFTNQENVGAAALDAKVTKNNSVTVYLDKCVQLGHKEAVQIAGHKVQSMSLLADWQQLVVTVADSFADGERVSVSVSNIRTVEGASADVSASAVYYDQGIISRVYDASDANAALVEDQMQTQFKYALYRADNAFQPVQARGKAGPGDFNVSAVVKLNSVGQATLFM